MEGKESKSNVLLYTVLSANLASFTAGIAFAWSSSALPRLNGNVEPEKNPLPKPITTTEESFIASLIAIGGIIGPLFATMLSDKIGRKKTLIITTVPLYASFVIIAFAREVWQLLLARLLCGISIGSLFSVLPNYVAEISEKHNRGKMSCYFVLNITLGNLLIYSVGPYLELKYSSLVALIPPTLFFLIFTTFSPESPYYLVGKGKLVEAENSLLYLRQSNPLVVSSELEDIQTSVNQSRANKSGIFDIFKDFSLFKRLLITVGLVTFQQFSGVNSILFYLQSLFDASGSNLPPEISSIIIAIAQFLSAFITPLVIDKLGRRILLLISATGTLVTLIAIGVFFYLKDTGGPYESISWLPIVSLIIYILSYSFGFGPVPFTILGELFPPHIKAAASTITVSLCFCFTFVTTVCFPYFLELVGEAFSFWFFGVCCAVSIIFIISLVPETKGKSLVEIQKMFER